MQCWERCAFGPYSQWRETGWVTNPGQTMFHFVIKLHSDCNLAKQLLALGGGLDDFGGTAPVFASSQCSSNWGHGRTHIPLSATIDTLVVYHSPSSVWELHLRGRLVTCYLCSPLSVKHILLHYGQLETVFMKDSWLELSLQCSSIQLAALFCGCMQIGKWKTVTENSITFVETALLIRACVPPNSNVSNVIYCRSKWIWIASALTRQLIYLYSHECQFVQAEIISLPTGRIVTEFYWLWWRLFTVCCATMRLIFLLLDGFHIHTY